MCGGEEGVVPFDEGVELAEGEVDDDAVALFSSLDGGKKRGAALVSGSELDMMFIAVKEGACGFKRVC